jgi:MFS family permease
MPLLFGLFTRRYAHLRKHYSILGAVLSVLSLVLSSLSTNIWHLILTQGVLQAFGSTLLYSSTTIYIDEWFVLRKGFAYGVILSVKSAVGAGTPLLFGVLLSHLDFRRTLQIWSAVVAVTSFPAIFLLRPRSHRQHQSGRELHRSRALSWSFLRHPTFYIFQIANIIFSSSYGMPQTYLASFASSNLHLSTSNSSLILAALNAPSIVASFWFGLLSDGAGLPFRRRSSSIASVSLISATGASLPALMFWGMVPKASPAGIALLILFAITYGFFAGGYSATWGGVVKEMQREAESHNEAVDTGLVFGLLNGGRGIGYMAGGFLGVELLKLGSLGSTAGPLAYGSAFGSLILYTGLGAAAGGISVLCRDWKLRRLW